MKLIAQRHPVDVCFIPIGDNYTMGLMMQAMRLMNLFNPKFLYQYTTIHSH